MTGQGHGTKNRLLILLAAVIFYAGMWFMTHRAGVPQVRNMAVKAMNLTPEYTEVSERTDSVTENTYYCSSRAYAPFLVQADYGQQDGSLYRCSALYLWFFSHTICVFSEESWVVE